MAQKTEVQKLKLYNLSLIPEHCLLFWISPILARSISGSRLRFKKTGKGEHSCAWICKNELHTDLSAAVPSSSPHNCRWHMGSFSVFSLEETHSCPPKHQPGPSSKSHWSYRGERLFSALEDLRKQRRAGIAQESEIAWGSFPSLLPLLSLLANAGTAADLLPLRSMWDSFSKKNWFLPMLPESLLINQHSIFCPGLNWLNLNSHNTFDRVL